MELQKLLLLCQQKLHMKSTTFLYSEIVDQQYQVHYVFLCILYGNRKEKDHIERNICTVNNKYLYRKLVLLLFWFAEN